jgi:hypothetical protein
VQGFLSDAAPRLRAQGVLYPDAGRPSNSPLGHHNVAWQLAGDRRFRASAGSVDDVAAEIAAFPGDAILSSEDFESALGAPERLVPIVGHPSLGNHVFSVVFWVRDQASYLESLFFEMLRHGMAMEARHFCDTVLSCGQIQHEDWTFHFDYNTSIRASLIYPQRYPCDPTPAKQSRIFAILRVWLAILAQRSPSNTPTCGSRCPRRSRSSFSTDWARARRIRRRHRREWPNCWTDGQHIYRRLRARRWRPVSPLEIGGSLALAASLAQLWLVLPRLRAESHWRNCSRCERRACLLTLLRGSHREPGPFPVPLPEPCRAYQKEAGPHRAEEAQLGARA